MSIKVKAVERMVKFDKESEGEYRFVMLPELYNKLSAAKVVKEASLRSGMTPAAIGSAWDAIGEVITAWATEGHSVAVPGLGTMRFGIRAKSVTNVSDVATGLITSRRVIFTPSVDIKEELKRTNISITCYDRNGNVIKQVISSDNGDVEDSDNENQNAGENQNPAPQQDQKKTVTLTASPSNGGTVTGAGQYDQGASATIKAVAASGFHFVKWSDNNTSATRTVVVDNDITLQATFAANTPPVDDDDEQGGGGDI